MYDLDNQNDEHLGLLLILIGIVIDFLIYRKNVANKCEDCADKYTPAFYILIVVLLITYVILASLDVEFILSLVIGLIIFVTGIVDLEHHGKPCNCQSKR